jgi:hypothetical protein
MMILMAIAFSLSFATSPATGQPPGKTEKLDIVATVGCLREASPDNWTLDQATDPVPSNANAPPPKDIASMPKSGKNQFQLLGVSVFNLPSHRGHTVLIKGLHIKATPMSRLNVTSVTMVAPACEPAAK